MKTFIIAGAVVATLGGGVAAYEATRCCAVPAGHGHYACNLKALTPEAREKHERLKKEVVIAKVQDVKRVSDGAESGLRGRYDAALAPELEAWASDERKCCPFFHIGVEKAPDGAWLQITGPEGTQYLLEDVLPLKAM